MKKTIFAIALLLAANTGTFAETPNHNIQKKSITAVVKFTCPMHKQIVRNKPGKCPKCGMKLVPIKKKKAIKAIS